MICGIFIYGPHLRYGHFVFVRDFNRYIEERYKSLRFRTVKRFIIMFKAIAL
jgi:hypothetical protein